MLGAGFCDSLGGQLEAAGIVTLTHPFLKWNETLNMNN